jgi:hypothetical protein
MHSFSKRQLRHQHVNSISNSSNSNSGAVLQQRLCIQKLFATTTTPMSTQATVTATAPQVIASSVAVRSLEERIAARAAPLALH